VSQCITDRPGDQERIRSLTAARPQEGSMTTNKELQQAYLDGYIAGLRQYAWWRDGEQQVGSCGTTLKRAIAIAAREHAVRESQDDDSGPAAEDVANPGDVL
jgi:hypothetical protein